jgi:hypothetical protein
MMTGAMQEKFECTLYVYGRSNVSLLAKKNLMSFCYKYLPSCQEIKVIDVKKHPELIEKLGLLAFPTLIIRNKGAEQRLIGTLENFELLKKYMLNSEK